MSNHELVSIAGVAENGIIGGNGGMLWHIPEDFQHFKETTMGHSMIMGRATFESMGALPGRRSIVVTRDPEYIPRTTKGEPARNAFAVHSLEEALEMVSDEDAFVAGGAQIYSAAMPFVTKLLISEIPLSPEGDTSFPEIDKAVWRETRREPREGFTIVTYERIEKTQRDQVQRGQAQRGQAQRGQDDAQKRLGSDSSVHGRDAHASQESSGDRAASESSSDA